MVSAMTATVEEKLPSDTKPVFIEVLTDEELRVLDGGNSMVVAPYADQVAEAERDPVLRTAFRGLVARGIIDPAPPAEPAGPVDDPVDGVDPELAPVDVMLRADVQTLATLRTNAVQVVAVARTAKGGQDYWYAHSIEEITLVEEVSQDGLHRFALAQTDQLPELLVAATVLTDAAAGVGAPLTVDATDPEPEAVLAQLGQGYLRADILVRHRDVKVPPVLGVFTGPEGSWTLEAGAPGDVQCTPTGVRELRDRIRGLVA
jgi:hypothetical protein